MYSGYLSTSMIILVWIGNKYKAGENNQIEIKKKATSFFCLKNVAFYKLRKNFFFVCNKTIFCAYYNMIQLNFRSYYYG